MRVVVTDYERDILQNIEEFGWFCCTVIDPEEQQPNFSYSVGFPEILAAPEIIVFGLGGQLMHSMLWEIFRQVGAGKQVGDGASWSGLLEGFECVTRRVHESNIQREFLNSAMWHWGDPAERGLLPVYQLVWPSAVSGLYPWEEGDHDYTRDMQAPLYLASPIGNALN